MEGGREKRVEEAGIKYKGRRETESEGYKGRMECTDPQASLLPVASSALPRHYFACTNTAH